MKSGSGWLNELGSWFIIKYYTFVCHSKINFNMFDRKRQEGKSMIALQSQISGGTFLQNHVDAATYSKLRYPRIMLILLMSSNNALQY